MHRLNLNVSRANLSGGIDPLLVEREEAGKNVFFGEVRRPAVGCSDSVVEAAVGHVEPSGALVIEVG